ncbi:DUF4907 domain-containing protein [Flagellimonas sp.]|uniref:DUF4907 domain-containing protein n=1 Tax=Flagellimonas sp. TaxID=2058762 RepID=UPI003F4A6DE2
MKQRETFLYAIIFVFIGLLFFLFLSQDVQFTKGANNDSLELMVAKSEDDKGWMYSIYFGDKLLIRQEKLPIVQGNQRIPSELVAEKLGTLVLQKLRNGESPMLHEKELMHVLAFDSKKDSIF